jgi:hypothetical protein
LFGLGSENTNYISNRVMRWERGKSGREEVRKTGSQKDRKTGSLKDRKAEVGKTGRGSL